MAYLYHAFVSAKTDSADSGLVRPTNWNDRLEYSNFAATGPSGTDAFIREALSAARTYYVRTDGSDSNTGLTNTAGGAFLTIEKALSVVSSLIDFQGYTVTIQIGAGTYSTAGLVIPACVGQASEGDLFIIGDSTTPSNVLIQPSVGMQYLMRTAAGGRATVSGLKLAGAAASFLLTAFPNSVIATDGRMEYGICGTSHLNANGGALRLGLLVGLSGDYTISGGAQYHMFAQNDGVLAFYNTVAVTLTGTPNFSIQFAYAQESSIIAPSFWASYTGAATGQRYYAELNGVINTAGGGVNFFPGNVAGTTATGGQYA